MRFSLPSIKCLAAPPSFRIEFGSGRKLATEIVLHGTIRFENVHFHFSFWREQTLVATKLFLSLTRIDFSAAVSSRAVRISSKAVRVFPALSLRLRYGLHTGPFLLWFSKEIAGRAVRVI